MVRHNQHLVIEDKLSNDSLGNALDEMRCSQQ